MVSSPATTVQEYLDELPADRAAVVAQVRDLVNENLPAGYTEGMLYGMITWSVPPQAYRDTKGRPLAYVALAAQKNYYALYLMGVYADPDLESQLRARWAARGSKLDMGKSCLRFRRLDDLHADLVAEAIGSVPLEEYVARARAAHRSKA